ncbi:MAG: FHA domain-containing protein [Myxococcales bacterium]|nr:FHA domain-containing protein [Myxococcales bacterium]
MRNASNVSSRHHLTGSRFVIGREEGDIVLGDPQVSWRHGEFAFDGATGALYYIDLESSNGSFLENGQEISEPTQIKLGQMVRVGNCVITVEGCDASGREMGANPRALRHRPQAKPTSLTSPGWPAEQLLGDAMGVIREARERAQQRAKEREQTDAGVVQSRRIRTRTKPQRIIGSSAAGSAETERRCGAWYEVAALEPDPRARTFVMGLESGHVVLRVRTETSAGISEALTTCPGSLADFEFIGDG